MIEATFFDCCEVRMGSPSEVCSLRLQGSWLPPGLNEQREWVRVSASNRDRSLLALARWDIQENAPGFRLLVIDTHNKSVTESHRLEGCCESLAFEEGKLIWHSFGLSESGHSGVLELATT